VSATETDDPIEIAFARRTRSGGPRNHFRQFPGPQPTREDALLALYLGWLGSRVVSVLDSGAVRPGFKSQSLTLSVLGKLFTLIVPLFTKQKNW